MQLIRKFNKGFRYLLCVINIYSKYAWVIPLKDNDPKIVDIVIPLKDKEKIYKYLTSISKNVYIDKLDDIVNKYNNTYHITIKMIRISKHKNVSAKGYALFEEDFVIKKS